MIVLDEVKDSSTFKEDGTFEAKPMMHHVKGILVVLQTNESRAIFSLG
jgi:hypothetical protein